MGEAAAGVGATVLDVTWVEPASEIEEESVVEGDERFVVDANGVFVGEEDTSLVEALAVMA